SGSGIARILSHCSHGNLIIALLARRPEPLNELVFRAVNPNPDAVLEAFSTDTPPDALRRTFKHIKMHGSGKDSKLEMAVHSIKHSGQQPFIEGTYE
ncbi:hypothetical protein K432DRAFT_275595, partial [Lepidopterella palustris CBS 459.81]